MRVDLLKFNNITTLISATVLDLQARQPLGQLRQVNALYELKKYYHLKENIDH